MLINNGVIGIGSRNFSVSVSAFTFRKNFECMNKLTKAGHAFSVSVSTWTQFAAPLCGVNGCFQTSRMPEALPVISWL